MKLLRAVCDCGFITRKARVGYHFFQWWFHLYCRSTGDLSDVVCALPSQDRDRILRAEVELLSPNVRDDKATRHEASLRIEEFADKLCTEFIGRAKRALQEEYAGVADFLFNPKESTQLPCPQCRRDALTLEQVHVLAHCRADCGHVYQWLDSETAGCPKCGHRPHRFETEWEERFAGQGRTFCECGCSSITECISHVDGYCPKCGGLADAYRNDHGYYCGKHNELMAPFQSRFNVFFISSAARWGCDLFPNAKFYGDAAEGEEAVEGFYCVSCERIRQAWLIEHDDHE